MSRKNLFLLPLSILLSFLIITLSGCSDLAGIDLPPLPDFEEETASPSASVSPSPSPTPAAAAAPTAMPTPTTDSSASPTAGNDASPAAQSAAPTADTAAVSASAGAVGSVFYRTPAISISGQTQPSDMTQYSVFGLYGVITVDCGSITGVVGTLFHGTGEIAQESAYYPYTDSFSLAGTINNDLQFAKLTPDTYIYQLLAYAENGTAEAEAILISRAFTVTARSSGGSGAAQGAYSAKMSADTDNAALIWNYFIGQLGNPYAAAAILGNISTESGCDPMRVEGDLSGSFSSGYTAQVDSGSVSRESFVSYTPGGSYGHGYGLCQWGYERKGALYDLAVSRGCSVGDLTTQCEFIMQELRDDYPALLEYLRTADDAEAAAFEFCTVYEQAAVHGGRTTLARDYLDKYAA